MHKTKTSLFYYGDISYIESNPCAIKLIVEGKKKKKKIVCSSSQLAWTAPKLSHEYAIFSFFLFRSTMTNVI